jgi:hypothetical protein
MRQRLVAFGQGLMDVCREMESGRSLGYMVLRMVMLDGGLVQHFEERRDTSTNAGARRDAERVLEDLRSLCRAAQAFENSTALRPRCASSSSTRSGCTRRSSAPAKTGA